MKRLIFLLGLIPALCWGQLNFQARVATYKKPDMTIRRYLYGPVEADTSYIGETGYLLPRYEQPCHSAASKSYWSTVIFARLDSGDTLQYANSDGSVSGAVFPGTTGDDSTAAGSIADLLMTDPYSKVLDNEGNAVYQLPEGEQ